MEETEEKAGSFRQVVPKHKLDDQRYVHHNLKGNRNNAIRTTKYTIWSFIPKNLFEQFHRFANIYFLFIVALNWVPAINAFGREIAMLPLIFVLSVTAIKDLFEDRRRYNSDKKVNNTVCQVFDSSCSDYVPTKWKDVAVGDIVKLTSNQIIPADLLLLNSSDENSICYIETANLDGETNLKQREVVKGLCQAGENFSPLLFNWILKCEKPNNHIYRFHGALEKEDKTKLPVGKQNLLLRGCILRNTEQVAGMVVYAGHDTKAMLNNSGPRYKHSKVERDLNLDVIACVVILFTLCFLGGVGCGVWTQKNDFFNSHFTPGGHDPALEGFIRFWTFIIILQVLIPYSLYVSAEIVKLGQVYLISNDLQLYHEETDQPVLCRALNINEDLGQIKYVFSDKTGTLTENKMVFKKCTIGGVNFKHSDKKGFIDEPDAGPSSSGVTEDHLYMQQVESKGFDELPWDSDLANAITKDAHGDLYRTTLSSYLREFFILLSICNTVVVNHHRKSPQSQVTPVQESMPQNHTHNKGNIERKDLLCSPDVKSSPDMNHTMHVKESAAVTSMDPGGLTVNVDGGWVNEGLAPSPAKANSPSLANGPTLPYANGPTLPRENGPTLSLDLGEGASALSLSSPSSLLETIDSGNIDNLAYEAESPDEAALVKIASSYGFKLLSRTPNSVSIYIPGEGKISFEVLHVIAFDSARKRMSIVVKRPSDGAVLMYCKGADSAILPRLSSSSYPSGDIPDGGIPPGDSSGYTSTSQVTAQPTIVEKTDTYLTSYARDGLRTLCMARKELSDGEYQEWLVEHHKAETALHHRERLLQESASKLENNMELLGATGIEDRLQDGVPETIAKLREGGLKVWVLTGDKQETAINVGYACKLLDSSMQKITINAKNKEECSTQIYSWLNHLKLDNLASDMSGVTQYSTVSAEHRTSSDQPLGLIIDGRTLLYALEKPTNAQFLRLAAECQVVLCCRATPIQKASVVKLVRDGLKVMTLAIGDGANDVSMIQMADVGIGITGQEGMQAVMASDFAIARFRFLIQLLLVHGHWCYDRITKMILYFFYKNAMFVLILFWYQLYNGFSGSNAIDDLSLIFFQLIFTAVPPIVCGILDKDLPAAILKEKPDIYQSGQEGQLYTRKLFWATILDALYQSIVLFFAILLVFDGTSADDRMTGITMHQAAVILASLHLGVITAQWTWIHHFFLWGSVLVSFVWAIIFGVFQPEHKIYWVAIYTMGTKEFWALCALITVVALLPRFCLTAGGRTVFPSEIDKAQVEMKAKRHDSRQVSVDGTIVSPRSQASST